MAWRVILHPEIDSDLARLGAAEARIVLRAIRDRIRDGEPDKLGKSLFGRLAGYRRLRTGSVRIVYRVNAKLIEVLIVAVGQRRDTEIYTVAERRV